MNPKAFSVIILAAGKGTRMKSPLPKVLHPVAGVPIIKKVIDAARGAGAQELRIVVGYGEALVRKVVEPMARVVSEPMVRAASEPMARASSSDASAGSIVCFPQTSQLGTADAVRAAEPGSLQGVVVICNGDHPLIESSDFDAVMREFHDTQASLAVVSADLKNPGSLGRIVRHKGDLRAIVEVSDASKDTLNIREVNTGIYVVKADVLNKYLPQIQNHNAKKEFYLTDLIGLAIEAGEKVIAIKARKQVAAGVNTQGELARATRVLFARKRRALLDAGVLMIDPTTVYIEDDCEVGPASVIYPNVYMRAQTKVGAFCVIEPNCYLAQARIEDSAQIKANTYLESVVIGAKASVGPFARLRPGTEIGPDAHVGNFVEMKKTKFGARSKAGHLSYLGDATIGEDVNIGCGTITCNYAVDKQKYRTVIGDRVFVGSDTQFVAPITIGADAVIGSGSTITKDVPADALAVARGKQIIKENWVSRTKAASESQDGPKDQTKE
ncbi:MAG: bifunctional UDP-N-acetylglucosamine diphosphorylase/glucosamine-1-phosphate N-acetyltransferase GlmU [Bdellovibrionaceae bacterium]|nr:bifunctional UDP-N-acetylglucosamine diphosphorylase/glucosamine-1-phosphate N-acetyltransferase GlmU [Pseudobdellovibrionaceae bacterium]